jgi:hypothetical protein
VVFAVLAVTRLEIYERERWVRPSGEFRSNSFYILGEWLSAAGHPVRFSPRWTGVQDLSPREGGLFIQASLFDWNRRDILSWVAEGGSLLISVDFPWYWEDREGREVPPAVLALEKFLADLDIQIREPPQDDGESSEDGGVEEDDEGRPPEDDRLSEENRFPEEGPDMGDDSIADEESMAGGGEDGSPAFPDYDYKIVFEDPAFTGPAASSLSAASPAIADSAVIAEPAPAAGETAPFSGGEFLSLKDSEGHIRLIRRTLGKGRIAVAGSYFFMYNYWLEREANARLAWELTGGVLGSERPGILFVRGRRGAGGLFEILGERGNLLPPVLSALALVFIGFWMALPGFGVPLREESRRPLSITGRFSAEARFLLRHGALETYLEVYLRELRRRSRGQAADPQLKEQIKEIEEALAAGKRIGPAKTAVYLKNLMSALERI